MMKSLKIFGAALLGFMTLCVGCEDSFLEQKSPDGVTVDNFWQTKKDAEEGLAAVYAPLESAVNWTNFVENRMVSVYYTSDMVKPGDDAYNYPNWTSVYDFTYDFGNPTIATWWRDNYRGVNFANQVIEKVGLMTDEQVAKEDRDLIIAEARFMRGYYHFRLLSYFKEIIRRDAPTVNENINKGTSPRNEIYDFIMEDLKDALKLPKVWDADNVGRATKGAALAYLGKVCMFRAGEEAANKETWMTKARDYFKDVMDLEVYDLEPDFYGMFNGEKENSPESIFELQLSPVEENGAFYKLWLQYNVGAAEFGWYGEIYGNQRVLTELTKEGKVATTGGYDSRAYGTCFFNCDYFNDADAGRLYGDTYNDVFGEKSTTVSFRKYLPTDAGLMWGATDINLPLMRYADVLLMYAEAVNELGNPGMAIPIINEIREHHGNMPEMIGTTQAQVRDQIIHERVMEFTLEGQRFQDLRRWGVLEEVMTDAGRTKFDVNKHSYYDVPEEEVRANSEIDF